MMKKTVYAFIAALLVISSLAAVSTTLEGDRIAYVNSELIIQKMTELPDFKENIDKFEAKSKQYQAQVEKMNKEYETMVKRFEANEKLPANHIDKWSPYIKELEYIEIMNQQSRIESTSKAFQGDLADMQNKLYLPIVQKYKKVVEEVAKENGFTMVLEFTGIIYGPEDRKITRKVAQKLGVTYTDEDEKLDGFGLSTDPQQ